MPYQCENINSDMRAAFATAAFPTETGPHALRRIAAVGALVSMDGELYRPDRYIIHKTAKLLAKAGYPVHPEPEIDIYNLLPPVEADFLEVAAPADCPHAVSPADIVITCNVFKPHRDDIRRYAYVNQPDDKKQGYHNFNVISDDRLRHVSLCSVRDDYWRRSAKRAGAKVIVAVGEGKNEHGIATEIGTDEFNDEPFTVLIDSQALYAPTRFDYLHSGFGFLARPDYLAQIQDRLNRSEPLGRRGLEVLHPAEITQKSEGPGPRFPKLDKLI